MRVIIDFSRLQSTPVDVICLSSSIYPVAGWVPGNVILFRLHQNRLFRSSVTVLFGFREQGGARASSVVQFLDDFRYHRVVGIAASENIVQALYLSDMSVQ